ncbi:MAG: ATP-binding protein [Bacteroidota bacterium]|nr:ATP-binding protein [Bacteroidota bacterium]MDP4250626.1 ATP-binding protein [Bacteroidota bacterium]
MQDTKDQVIFTIVAVIIILLFLGVLFLVMLFHYNNKKGQMSKEQQLMKATFDKQLLESKLEIQEQTFDMIGQEIHDNVGQILSLAKVQLGILEQRQTIEGNLVSDVKESISQAMTELRDIAKSLSSERLQLLSLSESISQEIRRINRSGFIKITAQEEGVEKNLPVQQKLIAFRMVQEGFQNIIKHAEASEVKVSIRYQEEWVYISIFDNGIGFDPEIELNKREGLGLQNILRRAALVGGKANIVSKPGEGTTLEIQIAYA